MAILQACAPASFLSGLFRGNVSAKRLISPWLRFIAQLNCGNPGGLLKGISANTFRIESTSLEFKIRQNRSSFPLVCGWVGAADCMLDLVVAQIGSELVVPGPADELTAAVGQDFFRERVVTARFFQQIDGISYRLAME